MAAIRDARARNTILANLTTEHFDLLEAHLEFVDLPVRHRIETSNRASVNVVFPLSGMISVVAKAPDGDIIDIGLIGREGMTGASVVLGRQIARFDAVCQSPIAGLQIAATTLMKVLDDNCPLQQAISVFAYVLIVQIGRTAMTNGRGKLEERLARWLAMVADRVGGDEISVTHEFLSQMLGVRRPGVTVALGVLEERGLIRTERGEIAILDRDGLEQAANGFYDRKLRA